MRVGRLAFVRGVAMFPPQLRHRQFADDNVLAELLESAVHLLAVHQPAHHRRGFPFAYGERESMGESTGKLYAAN